MSLCNARYHHTCKISQIAAVAASHALCGDGWMDWWVGGLIGWCSKTTIIIIIIAIAVIIQRISG